MGAGARRWLRNKTIVRIAPLREWTHAVRAHFHDKRAPNRLQRNHYAGAAAQCRAMNCACIGMASTQAAMTCLTLSANPVIS